MTVGDAVTTTRPLVPWYSGYGGRPHVTIPAGTCGVVQSVNVPPVRGTVRTPNYYVVRLSYQSETWQASAPMGERI